MTRAVVIVGFLMAFVAGWVVGNEWPRPAPAPAGRPGRHGGWLTAELNLTPQQQEELKRIWSEAAWRGGRQREDRRRQLFRKRDEAVAALIRPEDRPRYEQVLKEFSEELAAIDREWHRSYQESVERTKEILTPEQRARYEQLLERQRERGPRERGRGEDRSTRPAPDPDRTPAQEPGHLVEPPEPGCEAHAGVAR